MFWLNDKRTIIRNKNRKLKLSKKKNYNKVIIIEL